MTADLNTIPAVRKLAEKMAREHYAATLVIGDLGMPGISELAAADNAARLPAALIESQARVYVRLLCDPTRPASRDAIARLIAEAIGLPCGATAPHLYRAADGVWWLRSGPSAWHSGSAWCAYAPTKDPAEALAIIAAAVLGGATTSPQD